VRWYVYRLDGSNIWGFCLYAQAVREAQDIIGTQRRPKRLGREFYEISARRDDRPAHYYIGTRDAYERQGFDGVLPMIDGIVA